MLDRWHNIINWWRWDYENQSLMPFEDMLRILLCNYYCLSDGSDFWAHIECKCSTSPIKLNTCCSASIPEWKEWFAGFHFSYFISDCRNLRLYSRHWPKCSLLVCTFTRHVISLMKSAFFWLVFRGPDCNVIAEQGGGPDATPSWAGSGPRAGGCPPLI